MHYERKLYLLLDTPTNRRYCGKYVDVLQYPDGRIEIQVAGVSLPYSTYNKLGTIDQGTVVENKRLGHVLRIAQVVQAERDNRAVSVPQPPTARPASAYLGGRSPGPRPSGSSVRKTCAWRSSPSTRPAHPRNHEWLRWRRGDQKRTSELGGDADMCT